MDLTQSTLNDLLARLAAPGGSLHLPLDIDPHRLVELMADRHGAPRTLVLDGFRDPTVDESCGAALLALLEGRAVTIRAWAYGDRWIGAGTARDAEGVARPVLATAPRQTQSRSQTQAPRVKAPVAALDQGEDWVERLIGITGWTPPPRRPDIDWEQAEARLGTRLPGDYTRMVETFGEGAFDAYLNLNQEPWTDLREDGLLIWAGTEHEDLYCWRTDDGDPDRWPVAVRTFDGQVVPFDCSAAEFVCRILLDPHHPFTMARYFDTHWFMNHRESE
ncbi:SMI1/KNR4 family protein [Streptomyces sp. NPDC012794]|uniref:SMI1/KNR4 family protein n=1 Tax=Streptomyces sp. NPDC012794 TaxID=3364850 RepID=UPI003690CEA7